ncbi:amidase family protein [Streptomyces tibetensis]|uniref:amidase family protein n=1 Tax=Streptomyces tibetensis TaxID=2382123 RepID=UPI0037F89E7C
MRLLLAPRALGRPRAVTRGCTVQFGALAHGTPQAAVDRPSACGATRSPPAYGATRSPQEREDVLNALLNAVVTLDPERARREAAEADATRAAGQSLGPLHGVPIMLKDFV